MSPITQPSPRKEDIPNLYQFFSPVVLKQADIRIYFKTRGSCERVCQRRNQSIAEANFTIAR
jgi:hypothetical protein